MSLPGDADLPSYFLVRPAYPYWTDRSLLNGVVELNEAELGDVYLEEIITSVMGDVKSWCLANERMEYVRWTDITRIPKAIKRAVTYGVVATLYARSLYASRGRQLIVIPPVSAKIFQISGGEAGVSAMEYWETRMQENLEAYLTTEGVSSLRVDTIDEDPVFTMEDIPRYRKSEP